ncbi:hypothetical protein [Dokdonella soli]
MIVKRIPDTLSAGSILEQAKAACAQLCQPGQMRRRDDLLARAQLIHAAISTRKRFKALYERSQELQSALDRFKAHREARRA